MTKLLKLQKFLSSHVSTNSWEYDVPLNLKTFNEPSQSDWNQTLITKFNQVSATIFQDTNNCPTTGGANVILISDNMVDILRTLELFETSDGILIPSKHLFGILAGRYRVYHIPKLTDENKIFVCRVNDYTKILDINNYVKVGVVKIKKIYNDC